MKLEYFTGLILIAMFAGVKSQNVTTVKPSTETAAIVDPFEEDVELRVAADTFCRFFLLSNPMGKIVLPYKPNCHYWWQCSAVQLKKHECQGSYQNINLHYDVYLDRCEYSRTAKCNYVFDEEEIIMEHIMEFYKKTSDEKK